MWGDQRSQISERREDRDENSSSKVRQTSPKRNQETGDPNGEPVSKHRIHISSRNRTADIGEMASRIKEITSAVQPQRNFSETTLSC